MKKSRIISLIIVIVALVGVAGAVYAKDSHHGTDVNMLVGLGYMGNMPDPGGENAYVHSFFAFTNPDPDNSIEITKIAIMHDDGTVLYEGPYLVLDENTNRIIVTRPMEPNEMWYVFLFYYIYQGGELTDPGSWLTVQEAFEQVNTGYTVKIFWEPVNKSKTCQLIGWEHFVISYSEPMSGVPDHMVGDARTGSPMINVTIGK